MSKPSDQEFLNDVQPLRVKFEDLTSPVLSSGELILEPLQVEHAAEMAVVLDDVRLHTFIGGSPATEAQLRRAYEHQVRGQSDDGRQVWLNWVVRDTVTGRAMGYVQATLAMSGADEADVVAHLAWVVGVEHQGRRVASRASAAMADWLREQGVTLHVADVHPDHPASQGVARWLGLHPSEEVIDGEMRWSTA